MLISRLFKCPMFHVACLLPFSALRTPLTAHRSPRSAFTLIQVVLAVALLGIAYIPASSVFLASNRTVQKGDLKLTATMVAQTMIDDLRRDRRLFQVEEGLHQLPTPSFPGLVIPEQFRKVYDARAELTIQRDRDFPDRLRRIDLKIRYKEYANENEVVLSTLAGDIRNVHLRSWK